MPMIDFDFSGWIRGVPINEAFDQDGNKVDVSQMNVFALATALNKGELTVDFGDCFADHIECKINMETFVASRYRPRDKES